MDRRDFLKTLAVAGAAVTVQHSEAMDVLAQTFTNAGGGDRKSTRLNSSHL